MSVGVKACSLISHENFISNLSTNAAAMICNKMVCNKNKIKWGTLEMRGDSDVYELEQAELGMATPKGTSFHIIFFSPFHGGQEHHNLTFLWLQKVTSHPPGIHLDLQLSYLLKVQKNQNKRKWTKRKVTNCEKGHFNLLLLLFSF